MRKKKEAEIQEEPESKEFVFDYRNFYEKGQEVWYVLVTNYLHTKEVVHCHIRSIYPKAMVCGAIDREGGDVVIPIQDRARIFDSESEAKKAAKKIKA